MIKITDKNKLDAEGIKRALMEQTDEYRYQFDKMLVKPNITEKERLVALKIISNSSGAIHTFLARKAGIDIRNEDGGMLMDSATGYFMAKIRDVEGKAKEEEVASGIERRDK